MLAWSEGPDNGRQKTRNHGYDVIVGGELFTGLARITPSQTCHAKPKTQINRRRTLPALSRWWDAYRKQFGLKDFSPKSQTLWHCSRLRSVALYLWLIGDIRQQSTVAAISGLHCRALVMVSYLSIRLTAWLQNSKKRAERSERLMYEQSHRDYLRSGYLHHRLPVMGLIIRHAITQSPAWQKCQRTEAGERGNYWHADASAWCCCARCKIHEGVSWC